MSIKKIIAIASAKGGVGKSSITSLFALSLAKNFNIGILDADIYGPNQHLLFDIEHKKPEIITIGDKKYFKPIISYNVKVNSMGLILDSDKDVALEKMVKFILYYVLEMIFLRNNSSNWKKKVFTWQIWA